jgi:hypothetical protein
VKWGPVLQCGGGDQSRDRKRHGLRVGCNRSRDSSRAMMRWHTSWASGGLQQWLPNRGESEMRACNRRILTIQKSFEGSAR